jgi:hypothetical protein
MLSMKSRSVRLAADPTHTTTHNGVTVCVVLWSLGVAYKIDGRVLAPGVMPSTLEELERVEVVYESTCFIAPRRTRDVAAVSDARGVVLQRCRDGRPRRARAGRSPRFPDRRRRTSRVWRSSWECP